MHGEMIRSYIGNDLQALEDFNNEYDRIDQDAETSAVWAEASQNWEDQQRFNSVLHERGRRSATDDILSAGSSESNRAGDIEREWKNPRTEEENHEIVNKVRIMYGLEPVDYSKQVKASRKPNLIDNINELAGQESDAELTKSQKVAKVRGDLERMNVGSGEIMHLQSVADKLFDVYGGESSISEFR